MHHCLRWVDAPVLNFRPYESRSLNSLVVLLSAQPPQIQCTTDLGWPVSRGIRSPLNSRGNHSSRRIIFTYVSGGIRLLERGSFHTFRLIRPDQSEYAMSKGGPHYMGDRLFRDTGPHSLWVTLCRCSITTIEGSNQTHWI